VVKRAVLLQVIAESRQFAVWHEDHIVKRLPIKGLVGQDMALNESLQYIQQEALAAPRRSFSRGVQENPTALLLGRSSLMSFFMRQLSPALVTSRTSEGKRCLFASQRHD
jgi:hypothetical protein